MIRRRGEMLPDIFGRQRGSDSLSNFRVCLCNRPRVPRRSFWSEGGRAAIQLGGSPFNLLTPYFLLLTDH